MSEPGAPSRGSVADVAPSAVIASPQVVDIDSKKVGGVIEAAHARRISTETWLRAGMTLAITVMFGFLNYKTFALIEAIYTSEVVALSTRPPTLSAADRIVTSQVLMSLIGATVVQAGVAIVSIVTYLFPKTTAGAGDGL